MLTLDQHNAYCLTIPGIPVAKDDTAGYWLSRPWFKARRDRGGERFRPHIDTEAVGQAHAHLYRVASQEGDYWMGAPLLKPGPVIAGQKHPAHGWITIFDGVVVHADSAYTADDMWSIAGITSQIGSAVFDEGHVPWVAYAAPWAKDTLTAIKLGSEAVAEAYLELAAARWHDAYEQAILIAGGMERSWDSVFEEVRDEAHFGTPMTVKQISGSRFVETQARDTEGKPLFTAKEERTISFQPKPVSEDLSLNDLREAPAVRVPNSDRWNPFAVTESATFVVGVHS